MRKGNVDEMIWRSYDKQELGGLASPLVVQTLVHKHDKTSKTITVRITTN